MPDNPTTTTRAGVRVTTYKDYTHMPSYTQGSADHPSKIKPGIHPVVVIEAENRVAKSGNELINLKCKVKLPNGELGPTFYDNLVFTPNAFWKIDQAMTAFGFQVTEGAQVDIDAADFDGLSAQAMLEKDKDDYWKVTEWIDPNDRTIRKAPMPDQRRAAAAPSRVPPPVAARRQAAPITPMSSAETFDDDDIPF